MFRSLASAALALTGLFSAPAQAGDFSQYEELQALITQLETDKTYAPGELEALFDKVARQPGILSAMGRPAESKEWKDYRPIFLTDARISAGLAFWDQYKDALDRAEKTYGVPVPMILAILGVETKFGANKGGYRVIEALSTLGFDYPPRAPFFRHELLSFLVLSKQNGMDPYEVRGSYAGAMGYPQFMPSSWQKLAVDFDGDGHIDLINNPVDAIGSIANYFKANGWRPGEPVAVRARISGEDYDAGTSKELKTTSTLADLAKTGITPRDPLTLAATTPASGIRLQGMNGGEFWIGFNNFYVITRYNRSILYAMAANQLASALVAAKQQRDASAAVTTTPANGATPLP